MQFCLNYVNWHNKQWCRSLLSIGGIICNFTPILLYFQYWGGWTSTTILFRCGNLVKTKKNKQMEHFFPHIQVKAKKKVFIKNRTHFFPKFRWRPKKKVFHKNETLFSPNLHAQMYTHSNYWEGCRCGPFSNYWGGYSQIIGGNISPIPLVSALLITSTNPSIDMLLKVQSVIKYYTKNFDKIIRHRQRTAIINLYVRNYSGFNVTVG